MKLEVEIHRHSPLKPWSYALLDQRQRAVAAQVRTGERGRFLLSELNPVITLGTRTPQSDLLFSSESFRSLGVEIYPTDRGGLATYHGPGQWVLFPVEKLEHLVGDPR